MHRFAQVQGVLRKGSTRAQASGQSCYRAASGGLRLLYAACDSP